MDNTLENTKTSLNSIDEIIIPDFSGPNSRGGKIFKSTPHIINNYTNMLVRSNIITILIFLCTLLGGFFISFLSRWNEDSTISYLGSFLTFFSFIMIVVFAISIPHSLSSYKDKMSKIYLDVSPRGIQGITIDENEDYVWFDILYEDITEILYNSKQISIYTKNGNVYNYDSFYNPREIYSTILAMSDDKLDLKFKTL